MGLFTEVDLGHVVSIAFKAFQGTIIKISRHCHDTAQVYDKLDIPVELLLVFDLLCNDMSVLLFDCCLKLMGLFLLHLAAKYRK